MIVTDAITMDDEKAALAYAPVTARPAEGVFIPFSDDENAPQAPLYDTSLPVHNGRIHLRRSGSRWKRALHFLGLGLLFCFVVGSLARRYFGRHHGPKRHGVHADRLSTDWSESGADMIPQCIERPNWSHGPDSLLSEKGEVPEDFPAHFNSDEVPLSSDDGTNEMEDTEESGNDSTSISLKALSTAPYHASHKFSLSSDVDVIRLFSTGALAYGYVHVEEADTVNGSIEVDVDVSYWSKDALDRVVVCRLANPEPPRGGHRLPPPPPPPHGPKHPKPPHGPEPPRPPHGPEHPEPPSPPPPPPPPHGPKHPPPPPPHGPEHPPSPPPAPPHDPEHPPPPPPPPPHGPEHPPPPPPPPHGPEHPHPPPPPPPPPHEPHHPEPPRGPEHPPPPPPPRGPKHPPPPPPRRPPPHGRHFKPKIGSIGIFTPRFVPGPPGHRNLQFTINVRVPPLNTSDANATLPVFATEFTNFKHVFEGDLVFPGVFVKTSNSHVHAEKLIADRTFIRSTNGPITGNFSTSHRLTLATSNAPIFVKAELHSDNDTHPTWLGLHTSNSVVEASVGLYNASDNSTGAFSVRSSTSNAPSSLSVFDHPVNAPLALFSKTSNNHASVSLHPAFEGHFVLATSNGHTEVHADDGVIDPSGAGRERHVNVDVAKGGKFAEGRVWWGEEEEELQVQEEGEDEVKKSRVFVKSSNAPVDLYLPGV